MDEQTRVEQALLKRYPNWPQAKARWMSMRVLGILR